MDDIQTLFVVMHRGLASLKVLRFKTNKVDELLDELIELRDDYEDECDFGVSSSTLEKIEALRKQIELLVNTWAFYNTDDFLMTWLKPID